MQCELKKKKDLMSFLQIASWKQLVARKARLLGKISSSHLNHLESNLVYFPFFRAKWLGAALEKGISCLSLRGWPGRVFPLVIYGGPNPSGAALAPPGLRGGFLPPELSSLSQHLDTRKLPQLPRALQGPRRDWDQIRLGLCFCCFPL